MFRKTILALVALTAVGGGSAAFAQERDGDGNPVPGLSVMQPATGWERAHAGPRPAYGLSASETARADRLSLVH